MSKVKIISRFCLGWILVYLVIQLVLTYINQQTVFINWFEEMKDIDDELKESLWNSLMGERWKSFLFAPCGMIFRLFSVSLCFFVGSFVYEKYLSINYSDWWCIAVKSEWIHVLSIAIILVFNIITDNVDMNLFYNKISLLSIFDIDFVNENKWAYIPFYSINVQEFLYWLILSFNISRKIHQSYFCSFIYLAKTYGIGLLFLVVILTFVYMLLL